MFDIMIFGETPSVLMNLLRSRCVVVLVKFLNVLADWTGEWIYLSLSLRDRFLFMFMLHNTTGAGRKLVPCSRGE